MRVVALKFIFEMTPLYGVVHLKLIFEPTVCRIKHFLPIQTNLLLCFEPNATEVALSCYNITNATHAIDKQTQQLVYMPPPETTFF